VKTDVREHRLALLARRLFDQDVERGTRGLRMPDVARRSPQREPGADAIAQPHYRCVLLDGHHERIDVGTWQES